MKDVVKKKIHNGKSKGGKKKAVSEDEEEDSMEGYTDSMKELAKKKGKPATKKEDVPEEEKEDSMEGYTEAEKKGKPATKKETKADSIPVASSSKTKKASAHPKRNKGIPEPSYSDGSD
ncbi:hypothetical protein JTB14_007901 [Gonioctena quinquepunctata]|nr:hypothetical protein JTB14_007901 [Gonioctena quinquepunctata]